MLYKAMQVKEIPIIFRGKIDGVPSEEPTEPEEAEVLFPEQSFTGDEMFVDSDTLGASFFDIGDPINEDQITIIVDGNNYVIDLCNTVTDGPDTTYIYNAMNDYDIANMPEALVNPDIPYALACTHTVDEGEGIEFSTLVFFLLESGSHTLKIETAPEPPAPPVENKKLFSAELTGNGQIKRFHARFACGENGTLHINPYVILNGNITVNLCDFAKEGENYISGDNEDFTFECYVPIETHAMLYVEAENVGEYDSMLDVAIVVQYEDFIEEESIVGYEGINLGRKRR